MLFGKQRSVRFGGKSPAIASSPHSFLAPGFTLYQVYLTKRAALRVIRLKNLAGFRNLRGLNIR
jgi:hypothetical protein